MDTILVTGGKGFLGKHIVSKLSELGYAVRVFARPHSGQRSEKSSDSDVIWGDIRDQSEVEKAVRRCG